MKDEILTTLDRLWISFGNLIDITPRRVTYSRSKLTEKRLKVSKRNDRDSFKLYFKNIGEDFSLARNRIDDEQINQQKF